MSLMRIFYAKLTICVTNEAFSNNKFTAILDYLEYHFIIMQYLVHNQVLLEVVGCLMTLCVWETMMIGMV